MCPSCKTTYTSLDAAHLMDMSTGTFRCEHCHCELRQTFGGGAEMGDEGDRRRHVVAMKDLLSRIETQCKPIMEQLSRIQGAMCIIRKRCVCTFPAQCMPYSLTR